ncbi:hypothetical protein V2J09_021613 [Rumex salicifolius]
MSWLVSSIANSLKLEDDEDAGATSVDDKRPSAPGDPNHELSPSDDEIQPRGVKEDLSEISKTLTRQFWGVASFLAPPAVPQISDPDSQTSNRSEEVNQDGSDSDTNVISGFRNDLSEIGGKFRTGISKISGNKAVSEFTKIASNFLQIGSEEKESLEDFAQRDFDMSDAQQEHALAVERLAPTLAALRIELCPGYMSDGCFWKIYFVLVHPRLSKHDAELLFSPQIAKTRAMLTYDLKTRNEAKPDGSGRGTVSSAPPSSTNDEHLSVPSNNNPVSEPINISVLEPETSKDASDIEVDKHPLSSTEAPVIDKQVIEEVSAPQTNYAKSSSHITVVAETYDEDEDEDGDDWLKDEPSDVVGGSSGTAIPLEDPEDVSFSDLEDDDDDDEVPIKSKKVVYPSNSTPETKESNDWLDIEDIDLQRGDLPVTLYAPLQQSSSALLYASCPLKSICYHLCAVYSTPEINS